MYEWIYVIFFASLWIRNIIGENIEWINVLRHVIDPFETIDKYGADATRWYMVTNASPWDNLKFDLDGVTEVQRKFFGTL